MIPALWQIVADCLNPEEVRMIQSYSVPEFKGLRTETESCIRTSMERAVEDANWPLLRWLSPQQECIGIRREMVMRSGQIDIASEYLSSVKVDESEMSASVRDAANYGSNDLIVYLLSRSTADSI